jgi:PASTA domain-containing protein
MSELIIDVDRLIVFIDQLRLAGYDIGAQQYINAQNLLLSLADRGQWPEDVRSLRTWLAPILCSSPREQENFYRRFDEWARSNSTPPVPGGGGVGPGPGPEPERPFNRKLLLLPAALFALIALAVVLIPLLPRTLSGRVIDEDTQQPLAGAQVSFDGKKSTTDQGGQFAVKYRRRDLPQELTVSFDDQHEPSSRTIDTSVTLPLTVALKSVGGYPPTPPPTPSSAKPSPTLKPPVTPQPANAKVVPIPTITPKKIEKTENSWSIVFASAIVPITLFGIWLLWKWKLRQSLLEKFQTAMVPRLERIFVKGATGQLFAGQTFRRTIQELRRHRQRGVSDLDVHRTVLRTVQRAGLFSPLYGSRQTLPEYLVLIDRASFQDQQAKLDEEIIRRLIRDNVFVDAYYFQGDPRTCRRHGNETRYVALQELAALHPDHHLIIFSDGSSFLDPVTGAPERWLEMCTQWPKRALLTPEPPAHWAQREWVLAEMDFMILPGTQEGLDSLSQLIDLGTTSANYDQFARPFPSLIRERPRRWLENHPPTQEVVGRLRDQLKMFLGNKGYFWLSACAVYPIPYWDITLYLGFKLLDSRAEIEPRLLSLVRLPWFRYGSMPDWLRLKLIKELSPSEERKVRGVLEELFLSVLKLPSDGSPIDIAFNEPQPVGVWKRLKARLDKWRLKRYLWQYVEDQPPDSPLRDYVFLTFMSGRKPRKLSVNLPDTIRRLFFPQGHALFGMRPVMVLTLAIVSSITLAVIGWPRVTKPAKPTLYQQMSASERQEFVRERANRISEGMSDSFPPLSDEAVESIRRYVDYYGNRVGNKSSTPWEEDLSMVFGRASQLYAPVIIPAFQKQSLSPLLGLYVAMSYTEFLDYPPSERADFAAGMFQLTPQNATRYGLAAQDRSDVGKAAPVAARIMSDQYSIVGQTPRMRGKEKIPDPLAMTLLILSYKRGPTQVLADERQLQLADPLNYTFWYFQANAKRLDQKFQTEDIDYVPRFFAAAIVGEYPEQFGLDMKPLSSYFTISETAEVEKEITDLISKFIGDERRNASDQLVAMYSRHPALVVNALIDAIVADGPTSYRINLYIARTLGSIKSGWNGTTDQLARIKSLQASKDYKDPTFKLWVDKAIDNFSVAGFINCDCEHVEAGLLTNQYRDQCKKAETALIDQFKQTGTVTGKCDSVAQGPNAKPSDRAPSTPTPPPTPPPTPSNFSVLLTATRSDAGFRVRFNAITRNYQGRPLFLYRFNFGDGQSTSWQSGSSAIKTYEAPTTYTASVEVKIANGDGKVVYAGLTITVDEPESIIPNYIGKQYSEVLTLIETNTRVRLGSTRYQDDTTHPAGTVLKQSPAAGTTASNALNGTKIDLVVARSPVGNDEQLVAVPDVRGKQLYEARRVFENVGLKVGQTENTNAAGQRGAVVLKQTPVPGTKVKKGTAIDLSLGP